MYKSTHDTIDYYTNNVAVEETTYEDPKEDCNNIIETCGDWWPTWRLVILEMRTTISTHDHMALHMKRCPLPSQGKTTNTMGYPLVSRV